MSRSIDERILEMRFDNKQFESGIKESMTSLHKLDELLKTNISAKSLDDISKSVGKIDVSGLNKAIESINNRFSALGIAAARVIENLTDGLINGLGNAIRVTTDSIVSGGVKRAMNIENAHFQLQGIIKDETEVQAIMQQANESVDGTAYSYDVAAKAASMFAATGIKSGRQMETALKGIAGVAATTNADYERVSQIFTTISGQGRVMADQLNQFANMGMNAAAALTKYMNSVNAGTAEASDEVKGYIQDITGGVQITEAELREMVSKSMISFDLFSEAMGVSFGEHAKDANKTFTGSMANIRAALARTGAMFISPLVSQDGEFVQFFNAVRVKVNEFNKALGASNGLAKQFTDWVRKIVSHLTEIVKNFKIANIYTQTFGNGIEEVFESAHKTVQKFGDGTQKVVDRNVYTPFHALVNIVHTFINVMKGLHSILSPIGQAFREVFIDSINSDDVYKLIESIEELSRHFKLSGEHADQLKQGFRGIFSIIKSVIKIFGRLAKAINPSISETDNLGDSIFDLIEWVGQLLEKFAEWIDKSPEVEFVISTLGKGISTVAEAVSSAFTIIVDWLQNSDIPGKINTISTGFGKFKQSVTGLIPQSVQTAFNAFIDSLKNLSGISLNDITESIKGLVQSIKDIVNGDVKFDEIGDHLIDGLTIGLRNGISNVIKVAKELADTLLQTVKDWLGIHSPSTEGASIGKNFVLGIVEGIKEKFKDIKDTISKLVSKMLGGATDGFGEFTGTLNGLMALIGGGALTYLLIQLAKGFKRLTKAVSGLFGVAKVMSSISKAAKAYEKDLKADAFKKAAIGLAVGIAAITASLAVLSKIDPVSLLTSVLALSAVMAVFGIVINNILEVSKKSKNVEGALNTAAKGFSKGFKNLGQALKIKAIGSAVKDFAKAMTLIVADIAAIYFMYKNDKEAFMSAVTIVGSIFGTLVLIAGILSMAGEKFSTGMGAFAKLGVGVLALSLAVSIAVSALKKILDLDFNWNKDIGKLALLGVLFVAVSELAIAVGVASKIAGDGGLKTGPLLAMCLLIISSVKALKTLLDMRLKNDWPVKLAIFAGLFAALETLLIAVGAAAKMAGGKIKATGTILAMCAFIATAIGAIMILSIFPAEMLKKGAIALGGILLTLGAVLLMASKMGGESAGKTVLGMAIMVGAITVALAFLSFIDWQKLIPGAVALGGILFMVALCFKGVSEITNENAYKTVLAMVGILTGVIAGLYALTLVESWESLLAAALAMSAVLLAVGKAFSTLNSSETPDETHIMEWILGILSVAAIAQILRSMGDLDWKTLLASGASIAGVLMGIAESFKIMNSSEKAEPDNMMNFIVGVIGAGIIGMILAIFSKDTNWESLLGLGASISMVLVAIGACFAIMNSTKVDLKSIGSFAAGIAGIWAIAAIISKYADQPWQQMIGMGVSISILLIALSLVMAIAGVVGTLGPAAAIGLATLDGFILSLWGILELLGRVANLEVIKNGGEKLTAIGKALGDFVGSIIEGIGEGVGRALEAIGKSLSNFMNNAKPFFDGLSQMDESKVNAAKALAGVVLALSAAEFLDGISNLFGKFNGQKDMGAFGTKLVSFGKSMKDFDSATTGINADHLKTVAEGAKYLIDIAKAVPNTGGWLAKLVGDNDIGQFGKALAAFAPGLALFDASVRMIKDTSKWKSIAEGTGYLIDMALTIPNEGGWLGNIVGENDIGEFGASLARFAPGLAAFDLAIKPIKNASNWKSIAEGTRYLVDLARAIPNEGGWLQKFVGNTDLGGFGKSISEFGKNIVPFHNAVKNIQNTSNWVLIANGAKMLMTALSDMQGGLLTNKVTEANISTIGKTISIFGKHIAIFNTSVSGIQNTSNWILIANGAKILMNTLVDMQGGLLRNKVTEANINSICKSIVTFGSNIAKFNVYVSAISSANTSQWLSITNGAKMLMNTLVDMQGGLLRNKVTEANISTIGKTISTFGKYISTFNTYVGAINAANTAQWLSVANGAKTLTDTIISMQGGLLRNKVTEANIISICKSILNLGVYMSKFNAYVIGIKLSTILNIVNGINALVSMCRNIETIDPNVMSKFSSDMAKMAKNGLQSFINTFTKQTTVALTTVSTMIKKVELSAKNDTTVQKAFYDLALRSLSNTTGYIKGINDKTNSVISAITTLLNSIIKTIKSKDNEYKTLGANHARLYTDAVNSFVSKAKAVGENVGKATISGLSSVANSIKDVSERLARVFTTNFEREGKDKVRDAAMELTNAAVRVFNDRNDTFKECGENAGEGFARGMRRKVDDVANTARDMAWEARRAIEDELGIYSPSRVLRADGQYTGEGFALGILDRIREVKKAAIELAQASVDGIDGTAGSIIETIEDLDPVITPMVDLTNVMEAANTINDLFSEALATVRGKVSDASNSMNRRQTNNQQNIQNGEDMSGTNVTFIQNNNSPKALSRIDIYRQTRNQLAQFKEAIERT